MEGQLAKQSTVHITLVHVFILISVDNLLWNDSDFVEVSVHVVFSDDIETAHFVNRKLSNFGDSQCPDQRPEKIQSKCGADITPTVKLIEAVLAQV